MSAEDVLIQEVKDAEKSLLLAERTLIFYRAYKKTGKMTAIHKSGARLDGDPLTTRVSPGQAEMNIVGEARALARWSES